MASDPRPGSARKVPVQDTNLERRLDVLFKVTRATDPGARRQEPDEDKETEQRFAELFRALGPTKAERPTDAASGLAFLQELWDRLNRAR